MRLHYPGMIGKEKSLANMHALSLDVEVLLLHPQKP